MRIRVVSALIALIAVFALYYLWSAKGLYGLGIVLGFAASLEYARLSLRRLNAPGPLLAACIVLTFLTLITTVFAEKLALFVLPLAAVVFLAMTVLSIKVREDLNSALAIMSAGVLGLLYCGVFPAMAVKLLELPSDGLWLFAFLAVVFAGDSFAYFTGRLIGKTKLLEAVSPKKTIEGALGGLAGSGVVGLLFGLLVFRDVSLGMLVLTALVTGIFAQIGDLFESLLKRIANVKDSGSIMPGHGGVLDRLDGVLFAAPVFYILVRFVLL
jgi:phosphatidate cytidylyltransferase